MEEGRRPLFQYEVEVSIMTEKQKEIINELYKFKSGINLYQVFDDWVELMAYAFSNAINFMQSREDAYIAIMNKYIFVSENDSCKC